MLVNCPICRKQTGWENNPYRPFCSEVCKLVDLGKWLDEGYRIPKGAEEENSNAESEDDLAS